MNKSGQKSGEQTAFELVHELGGWITSSELKQELDKRGLPSKNAGASLSGLAGKGRLKKHKYPDSDGQTVTLYGPLSAKEPEPLVKLVNTVMPMAESNHEATEDTEAKFYKNTEVNNTEVNKNTYTETSKCVVEAPSVGLNINGDLGLGDMAKIKPADTSTTSEPTTIDTKKVSAEEPLANAPAEKATGIEELTQQFQALTNDADQAKTAKAPPPLPASPPEKPSVPLHHSLLDAAGVPAVTVAQRGYQRATSKADLRALGFSESLAQHVPALVIPVHGPDGSLTTYLLRPDRQVMLNGRVQRYLTHKDAPACLDVPPSSRKHLHDSSTIIVLDDPVQADAVHHHCGAIVCAVALVGLGAEPPPDQLPEWSAFSLIGRKILLVFPWPVRSDLHQAHSTLKAFLTRKGANVQVVCVPETEHGRRTLAEFMSAEEKSLNDLLKLAVDDLPSPPVEERPTYERTPSGLVWNNRERGERVPLANFNAIIIRENIRDDDITKTSEFDIDIEHEGETLPVRVPAHQFRGLRWAETKAWARIFTRQRDKVLDAVRYLSGRPHEITTFTHTGWRELQDGSWGYLHGGGAITADGLRTDVLVDLPRELRALRLPPPPDGEHLRDAVRTTLGLLDLSKKDRITVPLFALLGRAVLGSLDSTPHLVGPTGSLKSSTAQVFQRGLGEGFHNDKPALSWISTGNANELALFAAKDALVVVDDFRQNLPHGQQEAQRLIFAQGNEKGRSRMVGGKTTDHPPRGLMLSTGEDIPAGPSLRARMFIIEVERGDILLDRLTKCQAQAAAGVYARAFSGYVRWLAPRIDSVLADLQSERNALRTVVLGRVHKRTEGVVADLMLGVRYFVDFAFDTGALTVAEASAIRERCWRALIEAGQRQAIYQAQSDPVECYLAAVRDALALGEVHLVPLGAVQPIDDPRREQWGWREVDATDPASKKIWEPSGKCIGWLNADRSEVYILPRETHGGVARHIARAGTTNTIGLRALSKDLYTRGLLVDTEIKRARGVYTVRPAAVPGRPDVLHLWAETLWPPIEPDLPDQPPTTPPPTGTSAGQVAASVSPALNALKLVAKGEYDAVVK